MSKRLVDVLRAEAAGEDLQEGPHGVHVFAMRKDGSTYQIGYVSFSAIYQNTSGVMDAISRIKFGAAQRREEE